MRNHVSIDAAGRIVLPKPVREALGLRANDVLDLSLGSGAVTLTPRRDSGRLRRKNGLLYLPADPSSPPRTVEDYRRVMEEIREERARHVSGEFE